MFICSKCPPARNRHARGISYLRDGEFIDYCCVHDPANRRALVAARNAFDNFTLDHVRDERGRKVTVNSIAELRAAEKRYNFALAVATDDDGKADAPPQHDKDAGNITKNYERKWARDPAAYNRPEASKGVSVGVARDADETLASRPNPV